MAIEAPLSSYKKKSYWYICLLLFGAFVVFAYDGYLSQYDWSMRQGFYQEHVIDNGGVPDSDMVFNRRAAPVLGIAGIAVAVYYFAVISKKGVAADEDGLKSGNQTIAYDKIQKINKTHFDSKGFFVVTYTDDNGQAKELKLSDRTYDNLGAVLDHLIAKII